MRQPLLTALFLFWFSCTGALGHSRTVEQKLKELDETLEQKAVFDARKEETIRHLRCHPMLLVCSFKTLEGGGGSFHPLLFENENN
jgi:hypothetical protein